MRLETFLVLISACVTVECFNKCFVADNMFCGLIYHFSLALVR